MAALMSFPFRLGNNGAVVTSDEGTPGLYAEQLATLILTQPDDRELVPDFGTSDPVFAGIDQVELTSKLGMFGPPITITDFTSEFPKDGLNNVAVSFQIDTAQDGVSDDDTTKEG